jgi:hypothetical protein
VPSLQLDLLGTMELLGDERPLAKPPTFISQSVLTDLALHRTRPQSRDHLANLLWGDQPKHKARRPLTTALWHIRRCLPEPEILLTETQTAQFDPAADLWLDGTHSARMPTGWRCGGFAGSAAVAQHWTSTIGVKRASGVSWAPSQWQRRSSSTLPSWKTASP